MFRDLITWMHQGADDLPKKLLACQKSGLVGVRTDERVRNGIWNCSSHTLEQHRIVYQFLGATPVYLILLNG